MKKGLVRLIVGSLVMGVLMMQPATVSANESEEAAVVEEDMDESGNLDGEDVETDEPDEPDESESGETSRIGRWIKSGARWWYRFEDNTYPSSTIMEIDGALYAFDAQGWMVTGWYKDSTNWYYFDKSGAMQTGWIFDQGIWYYLNPSDGIMIADSMEAINGETYRFNKSGAMLTGWYKDGTNWYYFENSGAMHEGWILYKGIWYYLNPSDGIMIADRMESIKGKTYLFNKSGAMLVGWQKYKDCWYYFEASGAMKTGWAYLGSKWYYLDPETGIMYEDTLEEIKGKIYGFNSSGAMVTGVTTRKVKVTDPDTGNVHTVKRTYYFEKSGAMKTGWVEINSKWSYFSLESGIRYEGDVYSIDGTNYAFDDNGVMVTGWYNRKKAVTDSETGKIYYVTDKYYFNSQGEPQPGWVTEGNDKYWINKDGWAVANGKYSVDKGRTAYFDEDGKFVKFV